MGISATIELRLEMVKKYQSLIVKVKTVRCLLPMAYFVLQMKVS